MPELIDKIYEAAALPDRWVNVLSDLGARFNAKGGLIFANSPDGTRWLGAGEAAQIMQDFLAAGWMPKNDRIPRMIAKRHPGFLTDLDFYTEAEIDTLPMYTEFLTPRGVRSGAATVVKGASDDGMVISIEGFPSHQDAREATAFLDSLRPHLARAAMLAAQLRLERARAAVAALRLIGAPAAVLNSRGVVQAVNDLFEPLVGSTMFDHAVRLRLKDAASDRMLSDALDAMRLGVQHGRSVPLRATETAAASVLHILPVRGAAHDVFARASVILVLAEAKARPGLGLDLLQGLFDLTPAEARLARGLAEGATLSALAQSLSVSQNTVRSQLQAVFAKTGLSRQADLVRVLASLALPGSRE